MMVSWPGPDLKLLGSLREIDASLPVLLVMLPLPMGRVLTVGKKTPGASSNKMLSLTGY